MIKSASIFNILHISVMWGEMMKESGILKEDETLDYEQFILELITNMKNAQFRCFIAFEDNKPVGFITGYVDQSNCINKLIGFCNQLFVHPDYRKNGIGDKLIDELHKFFVDCKVSSERFISVYDESIKRFWNKKGFLPEQIIFSREV